MALITRTYTFVDGTTAYGSQVDSEIANIVNTLNNLDAGTSKWDIVSVLNASSVPLVADNSTGSNAIATFKANGVTKLTIDSTGGINAVTGLTANLPCGSNKLTGLAQGSSSGDSLALSSAVTLTTSGYLTNSIVQSIQATDAVATTSSGTSYTLCNTSATITPKSANHKVKITVVSTLTNSALATVNCYASIFRGPTDLSNGNGFVALQGTITGTITVPAAMTIIDSPATTSATTYAVKIKSTTAADAIWNTNTGTSVMILEEIAA